MEQGLLFDLPPPLPTNLPAGLTYQPDFLDVSEERQLLEIIRALPLEAARYKEYRARRRVASFGGSFDYDANRLLPAAELIAPLHPLRDRVADWLGIDAGELVHTLVAEYPPGAPLGWHRDVPDFEIIAGVSLGSEASLRLRPYPPVRPARHQIVKLAVSPRSIYAMRGVARWSWQHSVAPVGTTRWSITFRTRRRRVRFSASSCAACSPHADPAPTATWAPARCRWPPRPRRRSPDTAACPGRHACDQPCPRRDSRSDSCTCSASHCASMSSSGKHRSEGIDGGWRQVLPLRPA
jgi:alkylated DNA repair dioxygenase AlkB